MKIKLLVILLVSCLVSLAQSPYDDIPYNNLKKMVKQFLFYNDTYSALDVYSKMYSLKPYDEEVIESIAVLAEQIRDYKTAIEYYEKLTEINNDKYFKYNFNIAKCLMYLGTYQEALGLFTLFKKEYKQKDAADISKLIKQYESGINMAMTQPKKNMIVAPVTGSINKAYTEFAPIMVGDTGLIYSSLKSQELISYDLQDPPEYMLKSRFYKAEWKDDEWVVRGHLKGPFNDPGFDVGNGAFSTDGSRFYFTKCKLNDKGKFNCQIYFSAIDTDTVTMQQQWRDPELLPESINMPGFTSTQPTVGRDLASNNDILYFISDRPKGEGGLDVWFSVFDKTQMNYEEPVNCGTNINTTEDEMSPFMHNASSTLFFSSKGGVGYGGLDIFKAQGQMSKFEKMQNLGAPANSGMDDLYYVINDRLNAGFLVSNREGAVALKHENCCDDIFSFTYPDRLVFDVEGDIIDTNGLPLKNAIVSLYLLGEGNEQVLVNRKKIRNNSAYKFGLLKDKDYKLQVYKEGYLNNSVNVSTKGYTYSNTFTQNIILQEISFESVVIKNIYYEYDSSRLTDSSLVELNRILLPLMLENRHIVVEIGSHTDFIGSDAYNDTLSQERAQSVVNFFISQGIGQERINAKGYGECCPIAENELPDGTDNPEGRAKNRRTEFKILGEVPGYSELLYSE